MERERGCGGERERERQEGKGPVVEEERVVLGNVDKETAMPDLSESTPLSSPPVLRGKAGWLAVPKNSQFPLSTRTFPVLTLFSLTLQTIPSPLTPQ